MIIRNVVAEDKKAGLALAKIIFEQRVDDAGMCFGDEEASLHFDMFLSNPGVVSLCAEENGELVGFICATIGAIFFCKGICCKEVVWLVNPKYPITGVRLLRRLEEIAKERGCTEIMMADMMGEENKKFYEKSGYKKIQTGYLRKLK